MAKLYLVGDIEKNDLWLFNTEDKTMARIFVDQNSDVLGKALAVFAKHGGTVTLGDSQADMSPEEVAKSIYQSALRGMSVSNVPICIASDKPVDEPVIARRDVGGDGGTRLDD